MKAMTRKERLNLVEKLERELAKVCQRVYETAVGGRLIIPNHPYVLVRVLPKEHQTEGGIWLAENSQNKPMYEGIVLSVWKPFTKTDNIKCDCGCGHKATRHIEYKCQLHVGQRVGFPHFEGIAMGEYLDDKYYRLVREGAPQQEWAHCCVLGTISYTGDAYIQAEIRKLTAQLGSITTSGVSASRGATPSQKY